MTKAMKKLAALVMVIILCLTLNFVNTSAASATVKISLSSSSVSIGNQFTATVKISGSSISAYSLSITYDSSVISYVSGSGATVNGGNGTIKISGSAAGSVTLKFKAVANGSAKIKSGSGEFYDIDYKELDASYGSATVTVATTEKKTEATTEKKTEATTEKTTEKKTEATTEKKTENKTEKTTENKEEKTTESAPENETEEVTTEDTRSNNYYLKDLKISPGTLEPEFVKKTKNYTVQLDKDVTSIVVSAEVEDEKSKVSVSGANSLKPGENLVKVSVTAENGAVRVYKITVNCGPVLGDAKVTVDGKTYDVVESGNLENIPEGFSEIITKYQEWEILAFESNNKLIKIVALSDEEGNISWFLYDESSESFTRYNEFSSEFNRYLILSIPEGLDVPAGFEKTSIQISGLIYDGAESVNNEGISLVYAMNINSGDKGFYFYDSKESAFLRYVTPYVDREKEEVTTQSNATPLIPATTEAPKQEEKKEVVSNKALKILLIIMVFMFLISILVLILMGVKISNIKNYDEQDDDYDDYDNKSFEDDFQSKSKDDYYESAEDGYQEDANDANDANFDYYQEDANDDYYQEADVSMEENSEAEEKASVFESAEEYNGFVLTNEGDYVENQNSFEEEKAASFIAKGIDSAFDITEDHIPENNIPEKDYFKDYYNEAEDIVIEGDSAFATVLDYDETATSNTVEVAAAVAENEKQEKEAVAIPEEGSEPGTDTVEGSEPEANTVLASEPVVDFATVDEAEQVDMAELKHEEEAEPKETEPKETESEEAEPEEAKSVTNQAVRKDVRVETKRNRIEFPDEDDDWE